MSQVQRRSSCPLTVPSAVFPQKPSRGAEHLCLSVLVQVEQNNVQVLQSFSQRMDGVFSSMQRCVQQHRDRHQDMLDSYSRTIGRSAGITWSNLGPPGPPPGPDMGLQLKILFTRTNDIRPRLLQMDCSS